MHRTTAPIVHKVEIAPGIHLLRLEAPQIVASAKPGQFVHLRCGETLYPLLRRPLSLFGLGGRDNLSRMSSIEIELLFKVVGKGTALLANLGVGHLVDILGPLGRGFSLNPTSSHLLLIAGGMGIAPLGALAEEAIRQGREVTLLAGAVTAAEILPSSYLSPKIQSHICTEDGSLGHRGIVTDLIPDLFSGADQIFACGPKGMLKRIAEIIPPEIPVQISLEQNMGCGIGACLGCVVETIDGFKRVCYDGPVFTLQEVKWL